MKKTGYAKSSAAASRSRANTTRRAGYSTTTRGGAAPAALYSHRAEVKTIDQGVQAGLGPFTTQLSTTAVFTLLMPVQQGTGPMNRIGNKIMARSLHFRGQIVPTNTNSTQTEYLRCIILYDRQPGTALPALADVLLGYVQDGAAATANSMDELNPGNYERFKVIRDIRVSIPSSAIGAVSDNVSEIIDYTTNRVNINEFCILKDLETHYKSTSNPITVANIATGAFYLLCVGNAALASNGYGLTWNARFRYHDL